MKERIIPFLKYRVWAYGFSLSLFVIFVVITIIKGGLQLGVDFRGGMKVIVKFEKGVHEDQIRHVLRKYNPSVQQIGEADAGQFIISTKLKEDSPYILRENLVNEIEQGYPKVEIPKDDVIVLSLGSPADEAAVRAKLAGTDSVMQKFVVDKKNEFVIYKKDPQDKKSKYNADSITAALRGGFKNLDILGGFSLVVLFDKPVDEAKITALAKKYGVTVARSEHAARQGFVMYRVSQDESDAIKADLAKNFKNIQVMSVENVGPAVGSYLRQSAVKLIIMSIVLMTIYLTFRFELRYAIGAMVALIHDITLAIAFCGVAGIEINIPVIAALLTIFGYSVNDTIVIFDRIRETTSHIESKMSFIDVMDRAITQTLSRTTLTVILTLYSVIALYVLGGEGISDFALVLIFGFVIGAYSSIYQASPVVLWWERFVHKVRSA